MEEPWPACLSCTTSKNPGTCASWSHFALSLLPRIISTANTLLIFAYTTEKPRAGCHLASYHTYTSETPTQDRALLAKKHMSENHQHGLPKGQSFRSTVTTFLREELRLCVRGEQGMAFASASPRLWTWSPSMFLSPSRAIAVWMGGETDGQSTSWRLRLREQW